MAGPKGWRGADNKTAVGRAWTACRSGSTSATKLPALLASATTNETIMCSVSVQ